MGRWISNFNTTNQFETFQETSGYSEPHVTLIKDGTGLRYIAPFVETRVVAKYNVTETDYPTKIGYNGYISGFSAIEIDDVEQPSVVSAYTFSTLGEHTVKYTLTDPTILGDYAFDWCTGLTSIDIPNSVTSIDVDAFYDCTSVNDVYCYPNPSNLTWNDGDKDDFKEDGSTRCHVYSQYLSSYQSKFGDEVNVTFVGDLT